MHVNLLRRSGATPLLLTLFLLLLSLPSVSFAVEVDLTRLLTEVEDTHGKHNGYSESFFGTVDGQARLIVTNGDSSDKKSAVKTADISINGKKLVSDKNFKKKGKDKLNGAGSSIEVPVNLLEDNKITVKVEGKKGSFLSVRVKQLEDVSLNIVSRIHFQVNASNFATSQAFYQNFGFLYWIPFPPTNTLEVAQAVGVDHPYLIHVEVGLMVTSTDGGLFGAPAIDLIEWFDPARSEPPYAQLNHLGLASVAFKSADLDTDMANLEAAGVTFLTQPAATGTRFAIFQDPDGVYYQLVETGTGPGVAHVNVNVSDFDRSKEFYKMLGYTGSQGPAEIGTPEVADLLGATEPLDIQGELVQHAVDGSVIELVEWKNPRDSERAYPPPINHLGINRMAYFTLDLAGDVAKLKAQGVQFLSEIAPCCSGPASTSGIVAFYDPDGAFVELLGAIP